MKEKLIEIYQNTKELGEKINIIPTSKKLNIDDNIICNDSNNNFNCNIIVEPLDTVSALQKYYLNGKTLVLNMASAKRAGGGVEKGSIAQEECLFRCSNLYNIPQDLYPLGISEYVYTKDISFVKDFKYDKLIYPIMCDVISIPAYNLNTTHYFPSVDLSDYEKNTILKIETMLKQAYVNGCENIILGAWGCGVFKNDPIFIANSFKNIINEIGYINNFKNIVFAVINDRNSVSNNYEIFNDILGNY